MSYRPEGKKVLTAWFSVEEHDFVRMAARDQKVSRTEWLRALVRKELAKSREGKR